MFQKNVGLESKVAVYGFSVYDINEDRYVASQRMGTIDAIQNVGGKIDHDSKVLVDADVVKSDIYGMTKSGFRPE